MSCIEHHIATSTKCELSTGCFLTVPSDFQYLYEKQVTTQQNYFFKKFLIENSSSLAEQVFFHFGSENRADQLKNHPVNKENSRDQGYTSGPVKKKQAALYRKM